MLRVLVAIVLTFAAGGAGYWLIGRGFGDSPHANTRIAMAGPELVLVAMFLVPFLVWFQGFYAQYGRRWWLKQGNTETGPFSINHLGQMMRRGELTPRDEVRKRWSSAWSPFKVVAQPPGRFLAALLGFVVGTILGGVIGYFLLGQVNTAIGHGLWIKPEAIFNKPVSQPSLDGMLIKSITSGLAESGVPIAQGIGKAGQEINRQVESSVEVVFKAIDLIRYVALGGGLLGAFLLAASLKETYHLVRGKRIENESQEQGQNAAPPISFECPKCNKKLSANAIHAGKKATCTKCGNVMRVPPT